MFCCTFCNIVAWSQQTWTTGPNAVRSGRHTTVCRAKCPAHSHRVKHETFFLVRGRLKVTLDGEPTELQAGQVLPIPPGHVHSFEGAGNSLLLELSMSCQVSDNYFEDSKIMSWLRRVS